ncbi:MAG: hypothetical protein HGA44_01405 [Cellulomonadaceae bacterium]|nr:hypothetical protein [Cellulomonadaceae bacterium]
MARTVTVGELRAELVGWPDDAPVTVDLPDRSDPGSSRVFPIVRAGLGDGGGIAAALMVEFPLAIAWPAAS